MLDEDLLTRLNYAVFGVRGDNGLVAEVRALRQDLQRRFDEEEVRRAVEARERKSDLRWRIGTTIAVVSAILMAAGIVASSL